MHQILNPDAIYILGDIHGLIIEILNFINKYRIKNSLIIQVGDFGVGFRDYLSVKSDLEALENLSKQLSYDNNYLIIIRGNHDNPKFWIDGQEPQFERVWLISDYEVVQINSEIFLFAGGAISIDRGARQLGKSWWEGEDFQLDLNKIENLPEIDVVITHTAPDIAEPPQMVLLPGCHLTQGFRDIVDESNDERARLTTLYQALKKRPRKWYYGHFHHHYISKAFETDFRCLGECEFLEHMA
jgi:hypothetical protein